MSHGQTGVREGYEWLLNVAEKYSLKLYSMSKIIVEKMRLVFHWARVLSFERIYHIEDIVRVLSQSPHEETNFVQLDRIGEVLLGLFKGVQQKFEVIHKEARNCIYEYGRYVV